LSNNHKETVKRDCLLICDNATGKLVGDDLTTNEGMLSQPELNFEQNVVNIF